MSNLSQIFAINMDKIRIRHFEYGGQKFRVRVPLASEAEKMFERVDHPPKELIDRKFKELSKSLYEKKDEIIESGADIKFVENDVIVGDKSLMETAIAQASGEIRIVESIKLLVPIDDTELGEITYEDVQKEFPLPIQLSLVKKIAEIISPSYEDVRKN